HARGDYHDDRDEHRLLAAIDDHHDGSDRAVHDGERAQRDLDDAGSGGRFRPDQVPAVHGDRNLLLQMLGASVHRQHNGAVMTKIISLAFILAACGSSSTAKKDAAIDTKPIDSASPTLTVKNYLNCRSFSVAGGAASTVGAPTKPITANATL